MSGQRGGCALGVLWECGVFGGVLCGVLVERLATHSYERTFLLRLPCLLRTVSFHDVERGFELLSFFLLASLGLLAGGWGCAG